MATSTLMTVPIEPQRRARSAPGGSRATTRPRSDAPAVAPPVLRLRVLDSGVGVPEDKLESIFDPFVQADSSVTRKFGGTGLGLAIVYRLCELYGWSIHFENRESGGLRAELRFFG